MKISSFAFEELELPIFQLFFGFDFKLINFDTLNKEREKIFKSFFDIFPMKHKIKIVILLVTIFLVAQLIGLLVTSSYKKNFYEKEMPKIELPDDQIQPAIPQENISITSQLIPEKIELKRGIDIIQIIISFVIGLVIATVIFILLMRIGVVKFMRFWFFFVVVVGLFIAFSLLLTNVIDGGIHTGSFYLSFAEIISALLAVMFAYFKIYKTDIIVHNITEIFVYAGIIVLFLPLLNVIAVIILLFLFSVYDFVAVFKTKHMQKMARFMIKDVRAFSGLLVPYLSKEQVEKLKKMRAEAKISKKTAKKSKIKMKINLAILGGGDIAFPMLFSSIVFLSYSLINSLFIILFSTIALVMLFLFGKKGEPYPALPPLTAGCLIGFLLSLMIF